MSSSPKMSLKRVSTRAILAAALASVALMLAGSASASAAQFFLNDSQNNPTDHCYTGYGPGSYRDLIEGGPTGAVSTAFGWQTIFGCTRALNGRLEAGSGSFDVWFTNTNKKSCTTSWFLYNNSSPTRAGELIAGSGYNGGPYIYVPAGTRSPTKKTYSFNVPAKDLQPNDQLMWHINVRTASGSCSNMTLHYGSASNPTNINLPTLAAL